MAGNPNWSKGKKSYSTPAKKKNSTSGAGKSSASKASGIKTSKAVTKPVDKAMIGASMQRLKPIIVETGWLTRVNIIGDGIIDLENSWTEFILWMLSLIYSRNRDKFMHLMAEYNVLSEGLQVSNGYIEYPECSEIKNEIYKLSDSEYYIEFRRSGASYIQALKGLLTILKVDLKEITFDIEPLNIKVEGVNTTYNDIKQVFVTETLENILNKRRFDIDITGLTVFGYKQKVVSAPQSLMIFMTWALSSYGSVLEEAGVRQSIAGVGLTTAAKIDEYAQGFSTMKIGEYYLYCCDDTTSVLKYLGNVALHIGIAHSLIEIEYKTLELSK